MATEKAKEKGQLENGEYTNADGKAVIVRFLGLRQLLAIYDHFEDGSELYYEERTLPRERGMEWVKQDQELAVFQRKGEGSD